MISYARNSENVLAAFRGIWIRDSDSVLVLPLVFRYSLGLKIVSHILKTKQWSSD